MRHTPLNFDQFREALGKLAIEINQDAITDHEKRIAELKKLYNKQKKKDENKDEEEKKEGEGEGDEKEEAEGS